MKPSAYSAYPTMHLVPCMLMIMLVMRTPAAMGFQGHLTAPNYYYSSPTTGSTTTCTFSRDLRSRMGSTISNNKCEPRMIRNFTILKMSNSSQNENSKSPAGVAVAPSQKAYRISAMLHLLSSLTIFIMPNRMEPTLLHRYPASKVGGATGFALAAGISYILGNGGDPRSRDGRIPLGSSGTDTDIDTYPESSSNETTTNKKLHFGIMMFSFIGMLAVPGEASFHPSFQGAMGVFGIMSLARFMSAWVGFKGWLHCNGIECGSIFSGSVTNSRGIQIRDLVRECKRGVRETWFDVNDSDSDNMQIEQGKGKGAMLKRKKKNIFSLFYWCALVGMLNNSLSFYHAGKVRTRSLISIMALHQCRIQLLLNAICLPLQLIFLPAHMTIMHRTVVSLY